MLKIISRGTKQAGQKCTLNRPSFCLKNGEQLTGFFFISKATNLNILTTVYVLFDRLIRGSGWKNEIGFTLKQKLKTILEKIQNKTRVKDRK